MIKISPVKVAPKRMHGKMYFLLGVLLLFSLVITGQSVGDYRSIGSGNWTNTSIWQEYNGSAWVAASSYPGQLAGTNDVTIEGGYTVSLSSNIPNSLNSLTVGDGISGTDTFQISGTSSLNVSLINITNGGFAAWTSNVTFSIPSGSAFVLTGGSLATSNPCSASKRLVIGSVIYSTCNGGAGSDYNFDDLNNAGGSLAVTPTSNSPLCEGEILNLNANPSGTGSSGASFSWSGTGPGSYTYNSSSENPSINGLSAGSYSYTVIITDSSGNTNSNTVNVTVIVSVAITTPPMSQTIFVNANATFFVNSTNSDTFQWQVSTDNGSSFSNISDGSEYTGAQTTNLTVLSVGINKNNYQYRVSVSSSTSSCPAVVSNTGLLSIRVMTILTNRRITNRVNKN